jgi:transcriptional regulator with XRE-family HTH domain
MQTDHKERVITNMDNLVSERLKKRRLMLGISLKETSNIGISIAQIQKYEKPSPHIYDYKIYKLVKFLKSSINYFLLRLERRISFLKKREP